MTQYEKIVIRTQENYVRYHEVYAAGGTPYQLSEKAAAPYAEQIARLVRSVEDADCVLVGGASGLSAAGGGDFYYTDTPSFRKFFGKFAEKYHFKGAFAGMHSPFRGPEERWGYLATFLHTTLHAPLRAPYRDLDILLKGKDFHILTTNQDTQFVKLYPESDVSEIQGDHRFMQCSRCCSDDTWNAEKLIDGMFEALGDGTSIPPEMIPRCPHCGCEAFPWVRGYGNFLEGTKYEGEYAKVSEYLSTHREKKILFLELGVGRLTPMFIQEPFWYLTLNLPQTSYISVNNRYNYMPVEIEDRGMVILDDIGRVLADAARLKTTGSLSVASGTNGEDNG